MDQRDEVKRRILLAGLITNVDANVRHHINDMMMMILYCHVRHSYGIIDQRKSPRRMPNAKSNW